MAKEETNSLVKDKAIIDTICIRANTDVDNDDAGHDSFVWSGYGRGVGGVTTER